MFLSAFWRRLTGRRRRVSFYDSDLMRKAAETAGPVNISWLTEEALNRIVENEPHTLRAEAAHHELESRARERLAAAMPVSEVLSR
ncbi:MAG TPA: hypothetical protein VGN05_01805 [Parvibaculum sp.]|jgi:adenylosuccinate synthase